MLTIYHLKNSRSERIVWLVEELGIPYALESFDRDATQSAPAAYKALHPLGRAPIIRDGDVVLSESGAIIDYILARHGRGKMVPKPDSADYPAYLQWLHFAEGSAMQHLLTVLLFDMAARGGTSGAAPNPLRDRMNDRVEQDLAFMNSALAKQPYFAGKSLTGADINLAYALRFAAEILKCDMQPYLHLRAYLTRIAERPAYQKALSIA